MVASELPWIFDDTAANALVLRLHVQPGARRTEVTGLHGGRLKIRLAAPAVEGKANAALATFIAKAFGVPLRHVEIVTGESSRQKTLRIVEPAARPDRDWLSAGRR